MALQVVAGIGHVQARALPAARPIHVLPVAVTLIHIHGGVDRSGVVEREEARLVARIVVAPDAARISDTHGQAACLVEHVGERQRRAVQATSWTVPEGEAAGQHERRNRESN